MIIMSLVVFVVGLCVGSFLNVIIYRWGSEETPTQTLMGRSFCPNCRHRLSWLDNIPLFSFLLLRGRCRYCQKPISPFYPLVELTTAIAFVIIIFNISISQYLAVVNIWQDFSVYSIFSILYSIFIVSSFIVLFFSDLRFGLIPDKITYPAIVAALIYRLIYHFSALSVDILAAIAAAGLFWLIIKLTKERGMGYGDVKLALLMSLVLGWPKILYALWFGFILGGIFSAGLLLLKRKKIGETIPLGPFLILGLVFSLFFKTNIF